MFLKRTGLSKIARGMLFVARRTQYSVMYRVLADRTTRRLPVPSPELIDLVAGTTDVAWFLEGGRRGARTVFDILQKNNVRIESLHAIMDFGCGCGRVIRNLSFLKTPRLYGTDYNSGLIDWCRQHLPFAQFEINQLAPPLEFKDATFDLIYAFSVFTHLSEALQFAWMDELARVLRPEGYLLISTHGESYLQWLTEQERAEFHAGRLVIRDEQAVGTNTCGAFHPTQYVREQLARDFQVVDWVKEGAKGNPKQDVFLLRKKPG